MAPAKFRRLFGPITVVWFLVMAVIGGMHIADDPGVLLAINPLYGVTFLLDHGTIGLVTLGAVFLAVTGSEALYADLGHFGRRPIQTAWFLLVLPALVINYFGQGALVLTHPETIENPFFRLVPESMLLPLIAMATAATIIASQAVITGAYSITQQAIQLGLLPRFEIRHTSAAHYGQIYIPRINLLLFVGVMLLVGVFRTSSDLAAAYVLAVAATEWVAAPLGTDRDMEALAKTALARCAFHEPLHHHRQRLSGRYCFGVSQRRLGAGRVWRGYYSCHADVAARYELSGTEDPAHRDPARHTPS